MSSAARDMALEGTLVLLLLLLMLSVLAIVRLPPAASGARAATIDDPAPSSFGGSEQTPVRAPQTGPLGGTLVAPTRPHRGDVRPAHGPYAPRHGRGRRNDAEDSSLAS
jgi:hypothetical protein